VLVAEVSVVVPWTTGVGARTPVDDVSVGSVESMSPVTV